jgi:hypothetical protein
MAEQPIAYMAMQPKNGLSATLWQTCQDMISQPKHGFKQIS